MARSTILRATGVDRQIIQKLRRATAVSMAAQNGHAALRIPPHHVQQPVTHRFAAEVREVVRIRNLPFVPAGFPEGRNVGQHHNVPSGRERFTGSCLQIVGGLISQCIQS